MTDLASPHLLRTMIAKNGELLRRLLAFPPADPESPAGEQHRAQVAHLRAQTELLNERLKALADEPQPAQPRRKPWLEPRVAGTGGVR